MPFWLNIQAWGEEVDVPPSLRRPRPTAKVLKIAHHKALRPGIIREKQSNPKP